MVIPVSLAVGEVGGGGGGGENSMDDSSGSVLLRDRLENASSTVVLRRLRRPSMDQ